MLGSSLAGLPAFLVYFGVAAAIVVALPFHLHADHAP
jgi:hypothetical protein